MTKDDEFDVVDGDEDAEFDVCCGLKKNVFDVENVPFEFVDLSTN